MPDGLVRSLPHTLAFPACTITDASLTVSSPIGTTTPISADAVPLQDDAGWFNPMFPTRITVDRDGQYVLSGSGRWNNTASGERQLIFTVNSFTPSGFAGARNWNLGTGSFFQYAMTSAVLRLVAGQYVEFRASSDINTTFLDARLTVQFIGY